MRRQGERVVHEAVPVHVRWIDGDPPPAEADRADRAGRSLQHGVIADYLRSRPGRWAMLPDFGWGLAYSINTGSPAAYRPSGSFEAVLRQGMVYVRYVGGTR